MAKMRFHILIVGGGVAGLASALRLLANGHRVTILFRDAVEGSSFTNQKWRHSGLLYETPELVHEIWEAYREMDDALERRYLVGIPRGRFMSSDASLLDEYEARWQNWHICDWGLPAARFDVTPGQQEGRLGTTSWVGGFITPDCVIDYPAMVAGLRERIRSMGGILRPGVDVNALIHRNGKVTGVRAREGEVEWSMTADHVLVTAGAWANKILEPSGNAVPVRQIRSNVLVYPGELVPTVTLWLGDQVTLVPYKGTTLVADHRFVEVTDPSDRRPNDADVSLLVKDLERTFSNWPKLPYQAHGCIKTESMPTGNFARNPSSTIFGASETGFENLTVAFPGKASLMFVMAQRVANHIRSLE